MLRRFVANNSTANILFTIERKDYFKDEIYAFIVCTLNSIFFSFFSFDSNIRTMIGEYLLYGTKIIRRKGHTKVKLSISKSTIIH
jgi:hypothetical protein